VNANQLQKIDGIIKVKSLGQKQWELTAGGDKDVRETIFHFAVAQQLTILEMRKERYSVENVFQQLTKTKA